ncbi:hypothetical protein PTTG_12553 [Puccinia triticina 1-1 BBBD Race 1]|uniref:Uncharacterized protein n=1 Tax=Puccinia triticina (isolate 1-1 / race 1 (BBBD)) TaxID=630390 RepID=A0A180G6T6_PUCT1|nr:hypothetical protein PTTG_12553 [Puccinia triticina 1-1 BBBD Race 1]
MYKSSSPFDWNSHQFSPIQSQLISYFGQPFSANANLSNIATSLLREFLDKREDEYLASSYDPETSIREPESQEFLAIRSALIGSDLDFDITQYRPGDKLVSSIQRRFSAGYDQVSAVTAKTLRTLHPKLPIATYRVKGDPNNQIIRALSGEEKQLLCKAESLQKFTILAKAMHWYHSRLLRMVQAEMGFLGRTHVLLDWLLASIIKPSNSLAVLGLCKSKESLAPWEDIERRSEHLFGQVQLELIKYFSERYPTPNIARYATFFICSYYCEHQPVLYKYLLKKIEQNTPKRKLPSLEDLSDQINLEDMIKLFEEDRLF